MTTVITRAMDELGRRVRDEEGEEWGHTDQLWVEYPDQVAASTGVLRYYNRSGRARLLREVHLSVDSVPTGADIIVDLNKNGATVFAAGSRPRILDGTNTGSSQTFADTNWANGSYLTIDIDQAGAITPGANLVVLIVWN